jgi:hypothetical protein
MPTGGPTLVQAATRLAVVTGAGWCYLYAFALDPISFAFV